MFMSPDELSEILRKEDEYIAELCDRWNTTEDDIDEKSLKYLRMGKRCELLGYLQAKKASNNES